MSRRAARVDANHAEIVAELRRLGCAVQSLAGEGKGVPDLMVCIYGLNEWVEVKTAKGKLTEDQVRWFGAWPTPVHIVRSTEDVAQLILKIWAKVTGEKKEGRT